MYFLWYLLIGLAAGWIASLIFKGSGSGLLVNLIVGLVGGALAMALIGKEFSPKGGSAPVTRFAVRMGADGHLGDFPLLRHRRHRPAVDRIAVHTAQNR